MATIDYSDKLVFCCTSIEREQIPGMRLDKVQDTRRKLRSQKCHLAEHLSIALDRLLEEILEQNP